jgi:putative DNA primase/helicase
MKPREAAQEYIAKGWSVVPLEPRDKKALLRDWQNRTFAPDDFKAASNIGVKLGEPSGGLVDVDLDCPEAIAFVDEFLPTTGATFGHGEHPQSHRLYVCDAPGRTRRWTTADGAVIVELRGTGGQTMFPPSIHPNGESVTWATTGEPARVGWQKLEDACAELAVAVRQARGEPTAPVSDNRQHLLQRAASYVDAAKPSVEGGRNNQAFNLAGHLAAFRDGATTLKEEEIVEMLRTRWNSRNTPPLDDTEIVACVHSAMVNGTPRQDKPAAVPPNTAVTCTDTDAEKASNVKKLADAILKRYHFARDEGGKLYVYADGTYRPGGEKVIRREVKRVLGEWNIADKWTSHKADEVTQFVAVDAPELWPQPPLDVLNVGNGLLDVKARELRPHAPAFLSPVQLPVRYDPSARCPAWEQFVAQTFPDDAQAVAWQIPAWLMLPYTAIQRAVLLLGEGANGKSTYLAAVIAFIGKHNIAALSLHKLESDKFSAARLVGKLANICPDLPSAHLAGTSTFKALVGGDVFLGERKYADSFEFSPFARLIFSANHPPRSADASHAFFRRWLVVPFSRTFDPAQQIPRNVLDVRLADPTELSGVLNKALDALPGLHAQGFIESPSMRDAWNEFRESTDPLGVWLDTHTVEGPDLLVSKAELLLAFNADARHDQRPTTTGKGLGQALKRLRPKIDEAQRTVAGNVVWVWLGIGLKNDGLDSRL